MTHRIGNFFIWVGVFLIFLFVLSEIGGATTCGFLIWGVPLLALGIYLWFRDPRPAPQETGRFRILKRSEKKPPKK